MLLRVINWTGAQVSRQTSANVWIEAAIGNIDKKGGGPDFGEVVPIIRHGFSIIAARTGIPTLAVTAFALVLSWRIFKRSVRLLVEVALATAGLLAATRLGWITW